MPCSRRRRALCTALALALLPAAGAAQSSPTPAAPAPPADSTTVPDTAHPPAPHAAATGVAATAGLILLGAAGAQTIGTPEAWPRTVEGFGRRVADQTGFYLAQSGAQRAIAGRLGWSADARPCPRRALVPLVGCAVTRTYTAVDRRGVRRLHVPLVASVGAATALSVAWRPERRSAGKAGAFVATRLAVVFAGFAGERLLEEWWQGRRADP